MLKGIRKGIYKLETIEGSKGKVQLLGSGSILRHVREAQRSGERLRRRFLTFIKRDFLHRTGA